MSPHYDEPAEERSSKRSNKGITILIVVVAILILAVIGLLVAVILMATKNDSSCGTVATPTAKPVEIYSDVHFVTFVDSDLQYDANLIKTKTKVDAEITKIKESMANATITLTQAPFIMDFESASTSSKTEYSLRELIRFRERFSVFGQMGTVSNPTRVYAIIYTKQLASLVDLPIFYKTAKAASTDSSISDALTNSFGGQASSEPSVTPNSRICKLIQPTTTTAPTLVTSSAPTLLTSPMPTSEPQTQPSIASTDAAASTTTCITWSPTTGITTVTTTVTDAPIITTGEATPSATTVVDKTTTVGPTTPTISPTISSLIPCSDVVDVVLLIDQSGSIADKFETVKTYIKYLSTAWEISPDKARVAVATFSDNILQSWTLSSSEGSTTRSAFNTAVDNLAVNPSRTDISSGLHWAETLTTRSSAAKFIIILTDGQQSTEYEAHSRDIPAKELIVDGFMILSVVIPDSNGDKNVTEMQQICGTVDNVFEVALIDNLLTDFQVSYEIQDITCHHSTTIGTGCYTVCNTTTVTSTVPTTTVTTGLCHIDLMFLIDHSESIHKDTQWPVIRDFIKNITDSFDIGTDRTLVSVTRFANIADIQFCFDVHTQKADLLNAIETLPYDPPGATAIGKGLQMIEDDVIISSCGYRGMKGTLILITDGGNNLAPEPFPIAESLRNNHDITIYAVGITTPDLDVEALVNMTGDASRVFNGTYQDLSMFAHEISAAACATTTTTTTTTPAPTTTCSPGYIDLVYLVDESESVGVDNFRDEIKPFLISVTTKLSKTHLIGNSGVRVAMAWFSSYLATAHGVEIHGECDVEFYLDQVDSMVSFDAKVQNATYNLGATDTTCGFNIVRDEVYTEARGEREGSMKILVVITDGKPNLGNPVDPSQIAKQMRETDGVIILTVGVTKEIDEQELIDWTGGYRDQYFYSPDFSGLDDQLADAISGTIDNKTNICACKMTPFNLAYLVDESESVYEHFTAVQTFMKNITDNVTSLTDDQSQFAMVWFSQATKDHEAAGVEFDWTVGFDDTDQKITDAVIHLGATNVFAGMEKVRNNIFDSGNSLLDTAYERVVIFISDGAPNLPTNEINGKQVALNSASMMRNTEGVTIISIGINNDELDRPFLENVAGSPDRVYIAESFETLGRIIEELVDSLNPCHV